MSRTLVLAVVFAVHAGLLLWLLTARIHADPAVTDDVVQLLVMPPPRTPPVPAGISNALRLRSDLALAVSPPSLDAVALAGPADGTERREAGVNWLAEAHRAVRAFEIRRDQLPSTALSVAPRDGWWQGHRPGDRVKTESGDWVVWVDADCYQIAGWPTGAAAIATPPETVCRDDRAAPATN